MRFLTLEEVDELEGSGDLEWELGEELYDDEGGGTEVLKLSGVKRSRGS